MSKNAASTPDPVSRFFRRPFGLLLLACAAILAPISAEAQPANKLVDAPGYQAALRASSQGLHDVAAVKYQRLLKERVWPNDEGRILSERLVDALIRSRQPQQALQALALLEIPEGSFWKGQALLQQRKYRDAETSLKEYLEKGGANVAAAKLALGRAITAQGRENTGRQYFKDLLNTSALVTEQAWLLWNESEIVVGRSPAVLKRLGDYRGTPEVEFLKACAHLKMRDGKQAEILLRRILEPKVEISQFLHDASVIRLAEAYALQGRPSTATRMLINFLDSDVPSRFFEQAFATLSVVSAEEDKEDYIEKLEVWSATSTPGERRGLAMYYLAQEEVAEGRNDVAIRLLESLHQEFPAHQRTDQILRQLMSLHGIVRADERVLELANEWRSLYGSGGEDTVDFLTGTIRFSRGEYDDAYTLFHRSASQASDALQKQRAIYNAAISALVAGQNRLFQNCVAETAELAAATVNPDKTKDAKDQSANVDQAARLLLERALHLATNRESGGEDALLEFIQTHPADPRAAEAYTAIAELCLLDVPVRSKAAHAALESARKLPDLSAPARERLDYTSLWLREAEQDYAKVASEGLAFLAQWPQSTRRDEIRIKTSQAFYRLEDYGKAQAQFEELVEEHPESPYAETALFFAGKAAMNLLTTEGVEKALTLWADVVARSGPLAPEARRLQAAAKRRLGKEGEALLVVEDLLAATPPPSGDTLYSLQAEKGELLVLLSRSDPKRLEEAAQVFAALTQNATASRHWRSRAGVLLAQCYRQQAKDSEALEACYNVVEACLTKLSTEPITPAEHQWFYRAGFIALEILEAREEWEAAANFADRLATSGGDRSEEAKQRATRLRLEHFLWEKNP